MVRAGPLVALLLGCVAGDAGAQLQPGAAQQGFDLTRWVSDVDQATDVAFLSDGRGVITRKTGEVVVVQPDGRVQSAPAATVAVDARSEKGLLGVVVDESDNLYFYASTGDTDTNKHGVYRGRVSADGAVTIDLDESLIGAGLEGPANHDGGGMVIHEGQLYVGVGDTGANASPPRNRYGGCLNKPNAKILRVNLDGSIPADNPLVGMMQVTGCSDRLADYGMFPPDERIYAWGLRNPWRFDIDPVTGLLWIGDVGEITQEEITVGGVGAHHGWPFHEGTVEHGALGGVQGCMQTVPPTPCTPPQHAYPRGDGVSVTGGVIPTPGCGWGDFEQSYFFGDFGNGRVWTIDLKEDRTGAVPDSRRDFATVDAVVSFRMGPDGAMYLVSYSGFVERLAPRTIPAGCGTVAPSPPAGRSDASVTVPPARDGGCGCRLAPRRPGSLPSAALALLALCTLSLVRRRRAR